MFRLIALGIVVAVISLTAGCCCTWSYQQSVQQSYNPKLGLGSSGTAYVGDTQAAYYGAQDGALWLVVWVKDVPQESESFRNSSSSSSSPETEAEGYWAFAGGDRIEWSCHATDRTTGTITINGAEYDLKNGAILLVAPGEKPPKVVQVQHDLSTIQSANVDAALNDLAKTNAEITAFVGDSKESSP